MSEMKEMQRDIIRQREEIVQLKDSIAKLEKQMQSTMQVAASLALLFQHPLQLQQAVLAAQREKDEEAVKSVGKRGEKPN